MTEDDPGVAPVRRPPAEEDLRAAVAKQMGFLINSGKLVAQGHLDEAVRLAVALRVLLHDTPRSKSILGQLGWKEKLNYVDSLRRMEIAPGASVFLQTDSGEPAGESFGLVVLRNDETGIARYVAPLDAEPVTKTSTFDEWWNRKVLHSDGHAMFSRWELIDEMAHRDGGAHVDPRGLTKEYEQFKLRGAGNFMIQGVTDLPKIGETLDMSDAIYPGDAASPTVLQIAWELLETLNRAGLPYGPAPT